MTTQAVPIPAPAPPTAAPRSFYVVGKPGERPASAQRPYRPYGAARTLLYARDPEVVLSGPANTGKSRACLEKLHLCAEKYAGMRGLIARKTRRALTESVLVTFEQRVLPEGSPILQGPAREQRHAYRYPNGSELVLGGMDDPQKVLSTEYDLIFVAQAEELTEDELEVLTTRLRNHVMPYQQVIGDCNPGPPTHWLLQRSRRGQTLLLESRHADNPAFTAEDQTRLDALSGVRRKRLRDGLWVAAEGQVWEEFDPAVHVVDRREIPREWPRYLAVDFGYTNPFVCQWWAVDPDGRLWLYREVYYTGRLVEDHAKQIRELCMGEPAPLAAVCDHDAEDRATLERHLWVTVGGQRRGIPTVPAIKDVSPGIQAVATRLRPAGDGKPRLFLLRDSLVERDPTLAERALPASTEEELPGYIWNVNGGRRHGEEPVKAHDHGADCIRYVTAAADLAPAQRVGRASFGRS